MIAPAITLTTDFGLSDCYVGVMKGVIATHCPAAKVIDLSHSISPHNILQAAYLIHANFTYFPTGTIHIIVVDPGVGSARKIVLAEAHGHLFLAPDNGILSQFTAHKECNRTFFANRDDLHLKPTSHSFHGRDIFAPLAAFIANGNQPESIGQPCDQSQLISLEMPLLKMNQDKTAIEGTIICTDHFGNLTTNITANDLSCLGELQSITLSINTITITGVQTSYAASSPGEPLLLINSSNYLEIAVCQGSAQTLLNLSPNDIFSIHTTS